MVNSYKKASPFLVPQRERVVAHMEKFPFPLNAGILDNYLGCMLKRDDKVYTQVVNGLLIKIIIALRSIAQLLPIIEEAIRLFPYERLAY